MKDKKYNILFILKTCNIFSITLVCALLWYVYNLLTYHKALKGHS